MPRDLIALSEWSAGDVRRLLALAGELRAERRAGAAHEPVLRGQTLALLFEKPSLRTRVSFEVACTELGGSALMLDQQGVGLGQRESVADVTRVLSRMTHGIAARVFDHATLVEMAAHSDRPVINMLSDEAHPCQALADALTLLDEFGSLEGRTVAFVGDGNNCARSLARLGPMLGFTFRMAAPAGFELTGVDGLGVEHVSDPCEAVAGADAVYCDTFVSMGEEGEKDAKLAAFAGYQVNEALLAAAPAHAVVLHCLPAYRGVEITDAVLDGARSRAFPQAENRLHAQKALLAMVMGGGDAAE